MPIQSRHLKAIEAYRKAASLAGDRALLHSKLGFSHAKLNQTKAAIVSLERGRGGSIRIQAVFTCSGISTRRTKR